MKAIPLKRNAENNNYEMTSIEEATHIELRLPGPLTHRLLPIQISGSRRDTNNWSWNGSIDKPTVKPSILTTRPSYQQETIRCHTFVNDGVVRFLEDCSHELKGKELDLLDIDIEDSFFIHSERNT